MPPPCGVARNRKESNVKQYANYDDYLQGTYERQTGGWAEKARKRSDEQRNKTATGRQ